MKMEMDAIQFESKREIEAVAKALIEWQEKHGKDDTVQALIDKLHVMWINW